MSIMQQIRDTYGVVADTDSYKFSHPDQYVEGATQIEAYIESRGGDFDNVMLFGVQLLLKEYFLQPLTQEQVDNIIAFQREHFFGTHIPNLEAALQAVVDDYNGYMPLRIKAVPEGKVIPNKNVLVTIRTTADDPRIVPLVTYMETKLMRLWAPTTTGTLSYHIKEAIYDGLLVTADNPDAEIDFRLHDFGSRGVSSMESAAFNGAAHLVNFKGSDTTVAIMAANIGYHEKMAGYSIPATEHSTTTSHGRNGEIKLIERMFEKYAKPGAIFATVADSYDIKNFVDVLAPKFKQRLRDSGATWVIRPDSGDPVETPVQVVKHLARNFGFTYSKKGFKVLQNVRVIQGDGIDINDVRKIVARLIEEGFCVSNVAFGMGGGLLQKHNRDTLKFAMKACAVLVNGVWQDVYKDPVIYDGTTWEIRQESFKKSKAGRLELVYNGSEYKTIRVEEVPEYVAQGYVPQLELVYENGRLVRDMTFAEVRANATLPKQKLTITQMEKATA